MHINIDRYVSTTSNPDDVLELHGFSDVSKVACCAAARFFLLVTLFPSTQPQCFLTF